MLRVPRRLGTFLASKGTLIAKALYFRISNVMKVQACQDTSGDTRRLILLLRRGYLLIRLPRGLPSEGQ